MIRVKSMSWATKITIAFVTIVTIVAEMVAPFKDFLKSLTGHHWITKSVSSFVLFFVLYYFCRCNEKDVDVLKEVKKVIIYTILGILALSAFFTWHYFSA